ncbi:MAG: SDR family NAD(P)-dependent oxidoreductase [Saprospiraceae bacterium]
MKLLLVGMGPGMGMSIARQFGKNGFEVIMVARSQDKLADYVAELKKEEINSSGYVANLADEASFSKTLNTILAEHTEIDILHFNASAFNPAVPSEINLELFVSDFKTGVLSALQAVQAVLPGMKSRKSGAIFMTGGGTAFQAPAALASLGVSKAAMRNLLFSVAEEAKPFGIKVGTVTVCGMIAPGSFYDPNAIAAAFWEMYTSDPEKMDVERIWKED